MPYLFRLVALATCLLACMTCSGPAPSAAPITFPPTMGEYLILPVRAIDGDTIVFYWLIEDRARLHGINAPELKGATRPAGAAAKDYLTGKLPTSPVTCRVRGKEKYGRALLEVFTSDGQSLGKLLIDAGHARPYLEDR